MTLTCPNCGQQAGRRGKPPLRARFIERFIPWKGDDGEWEITGHSNAGGSYAYECEHCGTKVRKHRGLSKAKRRRARRSPKTGKPMCEDCGGTGNKHGKRMGYAYRYNRWLNGWGSKLTAQQVDKLRKMREQTAPEDQCETCDGSGFAWPKKWVKGRPE